MASRLLSQKTRGQVSATVKASSRESINEHTATTVRSLLAVVLPPVLLFLPQGW